ncbi:carbohydrate porin [Paraburkholderia caffeinilytica]|uniref:carbohydrate porin n=1 Tax=Paraburkholderia caffeinilytica TaxID=1761016 RepID=UPI003DA0BC8D
MRSNRFGIWPSGTPVSWHISAIALVTMLASSAAVAQTATDSASTVEVAGPKDGAEKGVPDNGVRKSGRVARDSTKEKLARNRTGTSVSGTHGRDTDANREATTARLVVASSTAGSRETPLVLSEDGGVNNPAPYNSEGVPTVKGPRPASAPSGPFATLGDSLAEHGINYQGIFLAATFNNLSTGVAPGHFGAQGIFINGVDLDLDKIASVKEAKIHIEGVIFPFTYPTKNMVNFGTFSSSYLGSDQFPSHSTGAPWLSLLTYEQTVFNDRLNFEFGKTNLLRYFFAPNCGLDFECTDSLVKWDSGVPDASLGTLGGRVKYNVTPQIWFEGGVQQLRNYTDQIKANGWDIFSTDGGQGAFMVGGAGYHTDFTTSAHPSDYHIDYYYANTKVTDPYYLTSHQGSSGVIFKMQQTIWSEIGTTVSSPADIPRSLAFFSSIERSFDAARPIGWGLIAGLTLTKPFNYRSSWFGVDQINVKAMYDRINKSTLLAQRDARMLAGGSAEMTSPNEYRFELSSTFSLTRYAKLEPVVEYILNPDSAFAFGYPNVPRSGWLAGVTLAITIGNTHL